MIEQTQYVVDAFTSRVFTGNPAAVCRLSSWLDDEILAAVARENNLSETAFIVGGNDSYEIRWITPSMEVDLCGHATLASAFVVFSFLEPTLSEVYFKSKSGPLSVRRKGELFTLDFPSRPGQRVDPTEDLIQGLRIIPQETYLARDYLCIVDGEEQVVNCSPKWSLLQHLPSFGIIVSAPGKDCDFVSRVFFPTDSILEDPVTGSAHCTLIPYWSKRLNKRTLHARQISERSGELFCEDKGERVYIAGSAVLYSKGTIFIPEAAEQLRRRDR